MMRSLFCLCWLVICLLSSSCARLLLDPSEVSKEYDFVIVGAGTAGSVLANRLTENPKFNVLVIEAGISDVGVDDLIIPFFALLATPDRPWTWNYTTTLQEGFNNRSIVYPRGRVLGGSSSVNIMVYTRGSSEDYDRFAKVTKDSRWSWKEFQPYLKKPEHFVEPADHHNITGEFNPAVHNFNGPLLVSVAGNIAATDGRVIQTAHDVDEFTFNLDMNSGDILGIGNTQSTIGNSARCSSSVAYLRPVINRRNLDVLIQTQVTKVLHERTINGQPLFNTVEFAQSPTGRRFQVTANKEVILSAGVIGTPQILMLSGIGDSHDLSKLGIKPIINLPSIGKNLSDHPLFASQWVVINNTSTFEDAEQNVTVAAEQLAQYKANGTGPLVQGPSNQIGWLRLPQDSPILKTTPDPSSGPKSAHFELLFSNGYSSFVDAPPSTGRYFSVLNTVASPTSRGTVQLRSTDPFEFPIIDPKLLSTDFDISVMIEGAKSARRFIAASVWDDYVIAPFGIQGGLDTDEKLEQFIRNTTSSEFHPVGTASMSPVGAHWGAVDPDLKLKGVAGLRIVDASVFPFLPAAHPQAAVYGTAELAADIIKASH
ncbi:aryl-alcohol-oxidase from pleurotus Eryingii [Collybia nuda]|uniref:Aryl-alcohol-oxidase from pleurotus Eryingii n=1 Tax=Collybia nuda TaxID=64659 RepID=A0A9P5YFE4_9AGAR|nr:aryl-alcohol-oxidase from pleurotus Eryingii [Collybia nuda]